MLVSLADLRAAFEQSLSNEQAWLGGFEEAVANPHYRTEWDNGPQRFCEPWTWDVDSIELPKLPSTDDEVWDAAQQYVIQSEVRDYIGEAFGYAD